MKEGRKQERKEGNREGGSKEGRKQGRKKETTKAYNLFMTVVFVTVRRPLVQTGLRRPLCAFFYVILLIIFFLLGYIWLPYGVINDENVAILLDWSHL